MNDEFFDLLGDLTSIEVLLKNQVYDLSKMREPWPLHEAANKGMDNFGFDFKFLLNILNSKEHSIKKWIKSTANQFHNFRIHRRG